MGCSRFLEEKLAGGGGPEFRDHLAECGDCRRDLEEFEEVRRLYHEASVERYPGAVPRLRKFSFSSWLAAAAAAAVLLGVLSWMLFEGPAERPKDVPGTGEPVAGFFRVHLAPWNEPEARLDEEISGLWRRLESLERRRK